MRKSILFILVAIWFVCSCKKSSDAVSTPDTTIQANQDVVAKNITTGPLTELTNITVPTSGTTIKIAKPNTPVDGLEIAIPANSFTTNPTLTVAYSEIKSHQFGSNFNPISPVISISCNGGYAKDLLSVTIPVTIPQGHVPLAFYIDDSSGKLESIPFKSISSNSITLLTRHFLPGSKLKSGDLSPKSSMSTGANIVVSSIPESVLNGQQIIASGFKPGTDDWEFVNYGSYIAPGGHCAGQTMAAMWYYYEKKSSAGSLFNKFSDNAKFWEDNARGYRFCSVIHNDLDWDGTISSLFDKYIDKNQELDKLKFLTIAGAMLITGEPQGVGIFRQTGLNTNGTPKYGGHDLICYQVSVSGGKLYISDPNKPGIGQSIDFKNNKFDPYIAKVNGNAASNPYPFVTYYAKTAYIEWNKIGNRYNELLDNTIGNNAPNSFPAYTLWVKDGAGYELKDGLVVTKDTLRLNTICPTAEVYYPIQNQKLIGLAVVDQEGAVVSKGTEYAPYVKLSAGANKLGYYVFAWRDTYKNTNGTDTPFFVDFKWITVNCVPLTIDPNPLLGIPNTEYKFTARSKGSAPKSCKFIWDFGDGSAATTVTNDSVVTHIFSKEGSFTVDAKLYDQSNKLLAEAKAVATIKAGKPAPFISFINKTRASNMNRSDLIAGDVVEISGRDFGTGQCPNCKVLFNGIEATKFEKWSDLQINVFIPFGNVSGLVEVVVENQKSNGMTIVVNDLWKYLQSTNLFDFDLNNLRLNYKDPKGVSQYYILHKIQPDVKPVYSISGNQIKLDYKYQPNNNQYRSVTIEGTFSSDGRTITNIKYDETEVVYPNTKYGNTEKLSFIITDISLMYWSNSTPNSFNISYQPYDGSNNYLKAKLTNLKYSFQDDSFPDNNITTITSYDASKTDFYFNLGK